MIPGENETGLVEMCFCSVKMRLMKQFLISLLIVFLFTSVKVNPRCVQNTDVETAESRRTRQCLLC